MRIMTLVLLTSLSLLGGCVIAVNTPEDGSHWYNRQQHNKHAIEHMTLGRKRSSVEAQLGDPDFVDSFVRKGSKFTVLYYRTRRLHDDGKTTRDETTPLVFVNGQLVGWGPSAVDHATAQ